MLPHLLGMGDVVVAVAYLNKQSGKLNAAAPPSFVILGKFSNPIASCREWEDH
jgi:hypothetical protein